jgi:hypothetical protein
MFHDVELSADTMQIYRNHLSRTTATVGILFLLSF